MTIDPFGRSLGKETDLTKEEFLHLVDLAAELRSQNHTIKALTVATIGS